MGGKGETQEETRNSERRSQQRQRRLGSQLSFQTCILMTINKNIPVTSASQISVYVQNVRSLSTLVTSRKLTRPLDSGCDIYIFVDARVTELKLRQLRSNFKIRMSDMQYYNSNSVQSKMQN